jgi:hypothetical protein
MTWWLSLFGSEHREVEKLSYWGFKTTVDYKAFRVGREASEIFFWLTSFIDEVSEFFLTFHC